MSVVRPGPSSSLSTIAKPGSNRGEHARRVDAGDARERWCLGRDRGDERGERARVALDLHDDAVRVVEHEPREPVAVSEPVDERPEADALNDPANPQAQTLDCEGLAHPPRLTNCAAPRKQAIPPTNCGIPANRAGAVPMHRDRGESTLLLQCPRRLS